MVDRGGPFLYLPSSPKCEFGRRELPGIPSSRAALPGPPIATPSSSLAGSLRQVVAAKAAIAQALDKSKETFEKVVAELEALLISVLQKAPNTAPLARKPYVTYMVYLMLGAPVVALGLPLLGQALASRDAGEDSATSSQGGGARGSKAAAKRAKKVRRGRRLGRGCAWAWGKKEPCPGRQRVESTWGAVGWGGQGRLREAGSARGGCG